MDNNSTLTFVPTARLFLDSFRAFETELAQRLSKEGFSDITSSNFNILRHLNPEGMHLSALAKDAQISKQAIGKMIKDLVNKGYVSLTPDQHDARAKHVRLTANGQKLIELAIIAVTDMEQRYQTMLGKENYALLRQSIINICDWHLNNTENKLC